MWSATKISAASANKIQVEAGLLLNSFNPATPTEPADTAIICATSGDFTIRAVPETQDFFEDVNNAANNTKEGKRITGWDCGLSVNALDIDEDMLVLALGAADAASGKVTPRAQYKLTDFDAIWWIGDMIDDTKLLCVKLIDAVSTGGFSLTTTKNGKGQMALEFTGHTSMASPDVVPIEIYVLTKTV